MGSAIGALEPKARRRPRWVDTVAHWFRPYELLTEEDEKAGKSPQFRHFANAVEVWGLTALFFVIVAALFPRFWAGQMHGGLRLFLATWIVVGMGIVAPFEWFFHRFAMHQLLLFQGLHWLQVVPETGPNRVVRRLRYLRNSITIRITYYVAKMAFGHGAHHKKTDVTPINPSRLDEMFHAVSKYEITTNDRTHHAVFPHFGVVMFWFFLSPLIAILQCAANGLSSILPLPHLPVALAAVVALTWQVWVYENSHAIMHRPYGEWWRPRIRLPIVGRWYSKVYRFHFFHHMNEHSSLGVVGAIWFWYVWDRIFGTYKLAREELVENASLINPDVLEMTGEEIMLIPGVTAEDFAAPPNRRRWVARLDEQSVKARAVWNELFVASLEEVRRRQSLASAPRSNCHV